MTQRLAGKVALVTAAGQGMGRACALQMAAEGATVHATDVNAELLESFRGVPNVSTRRLDVLDDAAVRKTFEELPPLDVLFNCAGYVHHGTVLDCDEKAWDFSFELNLKSMYRTIRAFLPAMLTAGRGSIVNMASAASTIRGAPNRFVYGTTKAGVIGLTKAVAIDFVARGIRCNCICPGTVETPSLEERIAAQGDRETARRAFIARQPMGRLGRADEVAALAVYLASDEASFTTGTAVSIDGGWSI